MRSFFFFLSLVSFLFCSNSLQIPRGVYAAGDVDEEELKSTIPSDPAHRERAKGSSGKTKGAAPSSIKIDEAKKRIFTGKIKFKSSSVDLDPDPNLTTGSLQILKQLASVLTKNSLQVRIEAHSDSVGSDQKNLEISQRRAVAVKEILVREGVSAERLEAVGMGDVHPIASDLTQTGQETNRRVEFYLIESSAPQPATAEMPPPAPSPPASPELVAPTPPPQEPSAVAPTAPSTPPTSEPTVPPPAPVWTAPTLTSPTPAPVIPPPLPYPPPPPPTTPAPIVSSPTPPVVAPPATPGTTR